MAAKLPYLQFYPEAWLADAGLQACNLETQGAWIKIICFLHRSETYGQDVRTLASWAQLLGISPDKARTIIGQLADEGVADIESLSGKCPEMSAKNPALSGKIRIVSRRMQREVVKRHKDRERKRKSRASGFVQKNSAGESQSPRVPESQSPENPEKNGGSGARARGLVKKYMTEQGLEPDRAEAEAVKFCQFWESKRWMVDKVLVDWPAQARKWIARIKPELAQDDAGDLETGKSTPPRKEAQESPGNANTGISANGQNIHDIQISQDLQEISFRVLGTVPPANLADAVALHGEAEVRAALLKAEAARKKHWAYVAGILRSRAAAGYPKEKAFQTYEEPDFWAGTKYARDA